MTNNKFSTQARFNWALAFTFLILVALIPLAQGQFYPQMPVRHPVHHSEPGFWSDVGEFISHVWLMMLGGFVGTLLGAFFSQKAKPFRRMVWWTLLGIGVILALVYSENLSYVIGFIAGFILAWLALRVYRASSTRRDTTFGSAEWATEEYLKIKNMFGEIGLLLGYYIHEGQRIMMHYTGERHLLTVAPTRAGKGVASVIPTLVTYEGAAVIIDPKGENAMITAARRGDGDPARGIPGMGQKVYVVDPWGITGMPAACFNPLDWLREDDPDVNENSMILADAIVPPLPHGSSADPFWRDEPRAAATAVLLFVALDKSETDRSLGRVRDIIAGGTEEWDDVLARMFQYDNHVVRSTAARIASMDPKLRSNIITSLQSATHFLDSPRIRESLKRSDFAFEDLKTSKMTVYLVLPADRLLPETFGKWLRLLIQQAITVNARNIAVKPEKPILFLLDEMAALGRLAGVEQAYSLMAGFGMTMWGIVQDLGQLGVYGNWETFIGNSGVLQYFGSRDNKTAEYFSKLCGMSTIQKFSFSRALSRAFSSAANGGTTTTHSDTHSVDSVQRPLAFADELMVMRGDTELLLVENLNPIKGQKLQWFNDEKLKHLGVNLRPENGFAGKRREFREERKAAA